MTLYFDVQREVILCVGVKRQVNIIMHSRNKGNVLKNLVANQLKDDFDIHV